MRRLYRATVVTAWNEIDRDAVYVERCGHFYRRLGNGRIINYEPQAVKRAVIRMERAHA